MKPRKKRETDEIERKGARAAACRCCCATKVAAPPSLVVAGGDVEPGTAGQRDKETEGQQQALLSESGGRKPALPAGVTSEVVQGWLGVAILSFESPISPNHSIL
ncbi:hypothetical protein LXL04_033914 [Taraxacum kok-saghyz]